MNINEANEYLKTAHMNRKVAKYLINFISEIQEAVVYEAPMSGILTKNAKLEGYRLAKNEFQQILDKEE